MTDPTGAILRTNDDGTLDEFIAEHASVHLEQMDTGHWWLGVQLPDGRFYHLNLTARGRIKVSVYHEVRK